MLSSLFINFTILWSFALSEVESPSVSFVKLVIWSSKDAVSIIIIDKMPKLKALLDDQHGVVSMGELSK